MIGARSRNNHPECQSPTPAVMARKDRAVLVRGLITAALSRENTCSEFHVPYPACCLNEHTGGVVNKAAASGQQPALTTASPPASMPSKRRYAIENTPSCWLAARSTIQYTGMDGYPPPWFVPCTKANSAKQSSPKLAGYFWGNCWQSIQQIPMPAA